jgi:hypothetical protein
MAADKASSSTSAPPAVQRLGKNQGRYLGETIEIQAVLDEIQASALKHGWHRDCFLELDQLSLVGYHRPSQNPCKRLYLSAGIHGDEPAGPLALLELMRQNIWPPEIDLWLCPCLNPSGFSLNTRENSTGVDLNRQYLQPQAEEIRAHIRWLEKQPKFDATLCLHEDWEAHGFYVYQLNVDNALPFAEEIIRRVAEVCPVDRSPVIEGREANNGIIRVHPDLASRPQWPEAFYLITHKTRVSCTLEAPSDFPLTIRVAALVSGVRGVLDLLAGE